MIRRSPSALFAAAKSPHPYRVVVADDSPIALPMLRTLLQEAGAQVHTIENAIGLSGLVHRIKPDVVILDINMPCIRGNEAIEGVRKACPRTSIVLFSDDSMAATYAKTFGVLWVGKTMRETLISTVLREAARVRALHPSSAPPGPVANSKAR